MGINGCGGGGCVSMSTPKVNQAKHCNFASFHVISIDYEVIFDGFEMEWH